MEIRRAPMLGGIFPDRAPLIRVVGAVLAAQHVDWTESRRSLGLDVLARSRTNLATEPAPKSARRSRAPPSQLPKPSAPERKSDHR